MSEDGITFWHYDDPIHDSQIVPADPGVTPGYLYLWDGTPDGPAWCIRAAVLTAPDGSQVIEQTATALPVTIVDDTRD